LYGWLFICADALPAKAITDTATTARPAKQDRMAKLLPHACAITPNVPLDT
jgi:hypothetical protein